nr:MAG TPA: hypothetical protein [Caudoviricetes sp.]
MAFFLAFRSLYESHSSLVIPKILKNSFSSISHLCIIA